MTRQYTICRVCGHPLFDQALLTFKNMPRAAQHLPDAHSLELDSGVDLEVCQCVGCGQVQLSNDPVPYYREVIRAAAISDEMIQFRLGQFTELVNRHSLAGKKVIEFGCGRGEYLALMHQSGADVYGIEYGEDSVTYCIRNGLNVFRGYIDASNFKIKNAPFDAFMILNFLEHLPDINTVLRGIFNNLSDAAIGLVEVPNFDMIVRRKLFSEFTSDHLYYFTRETLQAVLQRNGFDVIECAPVWHDYIISATVQKRDRLDLSCFTDQQTMVRQELNRFIGRFSVNKVAIWGAGHQALAVMALTDLNGKIRYVVDSAPFKQGKYTPATHIPIVAPDMLVNDPVEAIIVMAASYSDEVAGIIRQRFGSSISLAILRAHGLEML